MAKSIFPILGFGEGNSVKTLVLWLMTWWLMTGRVLGAECMTSDKKGVAGKTSVSNYTKVGAKWWYNWQHWNPVDFDTRAEMVPMVRFCKNSTYCVFYDRSLNKVRQSAAVIVDQVVEKRSRGGYWLIGNEPEVPGQDEIYDPVAAARMYREIIDFIKIGDPEAKIIVGGWAGPEEAKRNWPLLLQRKWPEYGQGGGSLCDSIAGWHFHHYAWPAEYQSEIGLADWKRETNDFANYLLSLCPGKEVWLTEFGSLSADRNNEASVRALANGMRWMVEFLESNEKITRYGWFYAIDGPVYEPRLPGLFTGDGQITLLGRMFGSLGAEVCEVLPTARPTLRPTRTLTPTPTTTSTPTPTPTLTPIPTNTLQPSSSPTQTPSPTLTPRPTSTSSLTFERICPVGTVKAGTSKCYTGDVDCNGVVNISDFGMWMSEYLDYEKNLFRPLWKADINCDGKINISDFGIWRGKQGN